MKVFAPEIPAEFLNTWLPVERCRELAEYLAVPEIDKENKNCNRIMTWNRLRECLPSVGYTIEEKRKRLDGKLKQCYFITGTWHDVELDDNNFLKLVEAKID